MTQNISEIEESTVEQNDPILLIEVQENFVQDAENNLHHPKTKYEILFIVNCAVNWLKYRAFSFSEIVLVNTSEHIIKKPDVIKFMQTVDFQNFLHGKRKNVEQFYTDLELTSLFNRIVIFNNKNLGIKLKTGPARIAHRLDLSTLDIEPLRRHIGNKTVFAFSNYMSNVMTNILSLFPNYEIYKYNFINYREKPKSDFDFLRGGFEKVKDNFSYLEFRKEYSVGYSSSRTPKLKVIDISSFSSCFKRSLRSHLIIESKTFYEAMLDCAADKTKKILLCGGDKYASDNFIFEAEANLGDLYWPEFANGKYNIKPNQNGLVFTKVEKLSSSKLHELCSDLLTGEYKGKSVILQSKTMPPHFNHHNIKIVNVPDLPAVERILDNIFLYMLKKHGLLFNEEEDDEYFNLQNIQRSKVMNNVLKHIPSLHEMDALVKDIKNKSPMELEFSSMDFWYDLSLYIKQKYPPERDGIVEPIIPTISDQSQIPKGDKPLASDISKTDEVKPELSIIHFTHPVKNFWIIISDSPKLKTPIEVEYKQNLGIKYAAYLAYYCKNYENRIRVDDLWLKVNDWHGKHVEDHVKNRGKLKKSPIENTAGNIKSAIYTSFVSNIKQLKFLNKDFCVIREEISEAEDYPFFYYKPQSQYVIEVDDEEIKKFPPPLKTQTPTH